MEVAIQVARPGKLEEEVELGLERLLHDRHQPEYPPMLGHEVGETGRRVAHEIERRDQAHRLQLDPPCPLFAHVAEDRPGDRRLRRDRIEMGADGARAVRVGSAQREVHAGGHIRGSPVGDPIGLHGLECAHERAVRVRSPGPDMPLVQMSVHVDRRRPDHPPGELHASGTTGGSRHRRDPPGLDSDIDPETTIRIGRDCRPFQHRRRHRRIAERKAAAFRDRQQRLSSPASGHSRAIF